MHPGIADLQAVLAAVRARRDVANRVEMRAGRNRAHGFLQSPTAITDHKSQITNHKSQITNSFSVALRASRVRKGLARHGDEPPVIGAGVERQLEDPEGAVAAD